MLRIKQGSVLDEKCDLVILPCHTGGGVTTWVQREIADNHLPFPRHRISHGKVLFVSTEARYTKADFIGYAASVGTDFSEETTTETISSIIGHIIEFAAINNCSIINIPVLGAGAGGLEHEDVINCYRKFLDFLPQVFNVYIPDRNTAQIFLERARNIKLLKNIEVDNPRVFISYSWKDNDVKDWVLKLAHRLCENGVDARLDRFHLKPGMDLPQWMTNEVIKSNKVLLICDSHYAEKSDMRKAGVGWETMIIQGDMMMQGDLNTKYIVVAFDNFEQNTPIYMRTKLAISKEDVDENFDNLLGHIFDIDSAPEIGKVPEWIKIKKSTMKLSKE